MTQYADLFEFFAQIEQEEIEKTKSKLTPRQWHLYCLLKSNNGRKVSQLEILKDMDSEYGFVNELTENPNRQFNSLSSARSLRTDLKALRAEPTIQKIIANGKIANTVPEAEVYLSKKFTKIMNELKLYWIEKHKLEKHLQMRLRLNSERDTIIAVLDEVEKTNV